MTLGDVIKKITEAATKTATALGTALVLAASGCGEDALPGAAAESCNPAAECDEPGCVLYDNFDGSELDVRCRWSDLKDFITDEDPYRWWSFPSLTNGTAQLGEGTLLVARHGILSRSGRCEQLLYKEFGFEDVSEFDYVFEYKARFQRGADQRGAATVTFATDTDFWTHQLLRRPDPGEKGELLPLSIKCRRGHVDRPKTPLLGVDVSEWNTYRIEKTGTVVIVTINGEEKARLEEGCETYGLIAPRPFIVDYNLREAADDPKGPQRLDLDYVKVICK